MNVNEVNYISQENVSAYIKRLDGVMLSILDLIIIIIIKKYYCGRANSQSI